MKYFSLNFRIEKDDYKNYYKDFGKAMLFNQLKRSLIMILFTAAMAMFVISGDTVCYAVTLMFVFFIACIMPLVFSKKIALLMLDSKNSRKENIYDFYSDHIEIHIPASVNSKASTEKHLKMNGFTNVTESKTNFYFSYMNEKMLIIPKRVLDNEKYAMIKNLIENYFSDVYMTV